MRRKGLLLELVAASTTLTMIGNGAVSAAAPAQSSVSIRTILSGLSAPRGIAFDRSGSYYVSESGSAGQGPFGVTQTGKVSKHRLGSSKALWSTSFSSLYAMMDPQQPPDVLGPEGISAFGGGCSDDEQSGNACHVAMIMSESTAGIAAASGGAVNDTQAGRLYSLDGATGTPTVRSDVGDQMYAFTGANKQLFPDDFPDSNPYGVLVTRDRMTHRVRTFVADAGANTISEIMPGGTARVIAYIPNETSVPFRDATPTCIAQGPDGALYVGTLHFVSNLFVFGQGKSDVWRVDPNTTQGYLTSATLWASGLTTVTGCTFDRHGNFWAAEMFQPAPTGSPANTPPGDVVRVPFKNPGQLTRFGAGRLTLPGGIAQGPDGAMYVTVNATAASGNLGKVMRLSLAEDEDQE